ncbi:zinc finger BED domain-containing protein RICESLEEPER 2, partial [Tanacetum coccineum]
EDLGIEANFNYTFISDRQKGLIQAIASMFPSAEHKYCLKPIMNEFKKNMGELKSFNYDAYDWLMKISLEQWIRAYFSGRAKDLLINHICEVFNRQLVDGRDQPIITCLEYIREYLMKRIMVVHKVIAKTVGPLTPSVTKMFDGIKKATKYNVQWNGGFLYQVTRPYKDQYVVNMDIRVCSCRKWELTGIPCKHAVAAIYNMFENSVGVVVESRTVIIPPFYKPSIGRPPKKRKKSNDEIESQSASSVKLSRKGMSVNYGKCGNVGHNRKGCSGQGGGSSQAGARKVSGQAAGSRKVSDQAVGSRKVSSQAVGARNVSGQAVGARKASSQPNAA